jgi:hypothetical protein
MPAIVTWRGNATSSVTPATAPAADSGTIHFSSDQSASREMRTPSATDADTSSSTTIGSTNSSGRKCDRIGTTNSAAPKAEMPNTT